MKTPNLNNLSDSKMILAFAYRERDRQITDVRQFHTSVVEKAKIHKDTDVQALKLEDFTEYFRKLQKANIGRLVEGNPTRFKWYYKPSSLMDILSGGKSELEVYTRSKTAAPIVRAVKPPVRVARPAAAPKAPTPAPAEENTIIMVPLRRNVMLRLQVQGTFTTDDLDKAYTSLKAVAK